MIDVSIQQFNKDINAICVIIKLNIVFNLKK